MAKIGRDWNVIFRLSRPRLPSTTSCPKEKTSTRRIAPLHEPKHYSSSPLLTSKSSIKPRLKCGTWSITASPHLTASHRTLTYSLWFLAPFLFKPSHKRERVGRRCGKKDGFAQNGFSRASQFEGDF
jgi:hypothetical protein